MPNVSYRDKCFELEKEIIALKAQVSYLKDTVKDLKEERGFWRDQIANSKRALSDEEIRQFTEQLTYDEAAAEETEKKANEFNQQLVDTWQYLFESPQMVITNPETGETKSMDISAKEVIDELQGA